MKGSRGGRGEALAGQPPWRRGPEPRYTWTRAMEERGGQMRRFGFRVRVAATVTVEAARASDARNALGGLLDGATAGVVSIAGMEIELADLEISTNISLLLVDGADPMAPVMVALSDWRSNADGGGSP